LDRIKSESDLWYKKRKRFIEIASEKYNLERSKLYSIMFYNIEMYKCTYHEQNMYIIEEIKLNLN